MGLAFGQGPPGDSAEFRFFESAFLKANGPGHERKRDEAYAAISRSVSALRAKSAKVTLGGMLALIRFESGFRIGFYNTKCSENDFRQRLKIAEMCWDEPLARYSYQIGIVPVHTSNFRPCHIGTVRARAEAEKLFDANQISINQNELDSVRLQFDDVCSSVAQSNRLQKPSRPQRIDYFILKAHERYGIPTDCASGRSTCVAKEGQMDTSYPLFSPAVTTGLFFLEIADKASTIGCDAEAICVWGGLNGSYCRQSQILAPWRSICKTQAE